MDISLIENKYRAHTELYEQLKGAFHSEKITVRFPISHEVINDISKGISDIFESLLKLAKDNNLYSCFILYRAILEHFYKGMYLIHKMAKTTNDETSEKFKMYYFISEFLAEKAGVLDMEDLLNDNQVRTDFLKFFTAKYPEMQGFDKANQQEISAAIRQFNLKEIVKFLHEEYKAIPEIRGNKIVAATLPEYSHVSTFTHGGRYATILMEKYQKADDIENQLSKILQIALTSTGVTKENLFMTYEIDKSFQAALEKLHSLRS